ncbi:MAG: glycoside hydrolase [Actinomycetota bacterium]|nr:glycoside hydrolase [Actinomycetota bacterium]
MSRDGTAFLPCRTCNINNDITGVSGGLVGGAVPHDGGRTWPSYMIPGATWPIRGFDPSVATTEDNTVYEAWGAAGNYHPLVAMSRDHGTTWTKPFDMATTTRDRIEASAFHAVVAGSNGRVAIAFLGSPDSGSTAVTPFDSGFAGHWYLYVAFTYDGGSHWQTARASSTVMQVGGICDSGTTCLSGRNLLDFMDATVDASGRVVVGLAEGCHGGCDPDSTHPSTDAWAAVVRQNNGPGSRTTRTSPSALDRQTLHTFRLDPLVCCTDGRRIGLGRLGIGPTQ